MSDSASAQNIEEASSTQPYPNQRYAWWVAVVLATAYTVGYIDRQALSLMTDMVKADLGVSDSYMGWLNGSFGLFYAIAGMPIGYMADKKSRRAIISVGILLWTIACAACGLAQTFWQLFAARVGVGVGESTLLPCTHSLLGDYFPPRKLPRAMSVFQMGGITGSGLAFFVVGTVISMVEGSEPLTLPRFGPLAPWQETFMYVALPGFAMLALMLTVKEPLRRMVSGARGGGSAKTREVVDFYRANWQTLTCHHLGFASMSIVAFGVIGWMAPFFGRTYGVAPATFGQIYGIYQIVIGNIGVICVALLAEYLARQGRSDANILAGAYTAAAVIPVCMLTPMMPTETWAWISLVPNTLLVGSMFGLAHGALPVIAPPNMRARVGAFYTFFYTVVGSLLGFGFTGMLTDYLFTGPEDLRYSVMVMVGVFGPLGFGLLWLGRKHYAASFEASKAWHGDD